MKELKQFSDDNDDDDNNNNISQHKCNNAAAAADDDEVETKCSTHVNNYVDNSRHQMNDKDIDKIYALVK